jgi:DNA-binding response OmpR family regulator
VTKKPRLLVVDNEIDICNFVKMFFETRGFDVMTALNGDEAMKVLDQIKPDLIILDVMMRTEDEGIKYLPKIRSKSPDAKVIMITGVDDKDVIEKAKSLGADDYITKPLVLEYLESTVLGKIKSLSVVKK